MRDVMRETENGGRDDAQSDSHGGTDDMFAHLIELWPMLVRGDQRALLIHAEQLVARSIG